MKLGVCTAVVLTIATTALYAQTTAFASKSKEAASAGTLGIRLLAASGAVSTNPLASPYIVARLAPSSVLTRVVEIDNNSSRPIAVALYLAAASLRHGTFVFAAGDARNELTSWTSVVKKVIPLAPRSDAYDTVTVRVPSDAPQGNEYAVLWAAVSATPPGGQGITLVSRVGVRLYVAIGRGGGAPSNFVLGTLRAGRGLSGAPSLLATIHNCGANTLDLNGFWMLSNGPGGLHAGPFAATLGVVLAPGASERATVIFAPNFPRGPWRASLNVRSGLLSRSTSRTISFPSRFAARGQSSSDQRDVQLGFIGFVLLAGASFLFTIRRRRRRPLPSNGALLPQ
jgi:hypothetical protein